MACRHANAVTAILFVALCHHTVGREYEVRLLDGDEHNGVWGTAEFQLRVNDLGLVRHVIVHGQEVIWQAAALYTSPVPPAESAGIRTVQGEGFGDRGLTVEKPTMTTRDERGRRIFEFQYQIACRKVLDGRPLCDAVQRLVITPTGAIEVRYEFEWRETLRWHGFQLLLMFNEEACRDREYMIMAGENILTGSLQAGPPTERRIRSLPFSQLTFRPEPGPVHLVWDQPATCTLNWGKNIQLSVIPAGLPYRKSIYKGQKAVLSYRILLPISQQ